MLLLTCFLKLRIEWQTWSYSIVLALGKGNAEFLKPQKTQLSTLLNIFPLQKLLTKDSGAQDGCQVYDRNRKYQNWGWRREGSLKEEIVQKCCWIFIYNSKYTPREPVCSMPLSIVLHDQKVPEITENQQCKNSVMYQKNLMLLYFIFWKMKNEVLWKFCASGIRGDTSSFTLILLLKIFYILWKWFSKSACHNWQESFCFHTP